MDLTLAGEGSGKEGKMRSFAARYFLHLHPSLKKTQNLVIAHAQNLQKSAWSVKNDTVRKVFCCSCSKRVFSILSAFPF